MTSDNDQKLLNATFAQVREEDVPMSEGLMDRIMQDADGILGAAALASSRTRPGFIAQFMDAVGGWPALSGLAAATVAGVWIGVVQPASLTDLSAGVWGTTIEVPLLESDIFAGLEG